MQRCVLPVVTAAALTLAACQGDTVGQRPSTGGSPVVGASAAAPEGFACPVPGTTISINGGTPWRYTGTDPADPFVCLAVAPQGDTRRRLAAWTDLSTASDAAQRAGFAQLWPMAAGRQAEWTWSWRSLQGNTVTIRDRYRILEKRVETVAGREREVFVIERNETHIPAGNFERVWTFWYDPEARLVVRSRMQVVRGPGDNRFDWTATAISVPGT
jgi:hypothetical protein